MNLRMYQADSMAEALAAVKRDLGADAVILQTRTFRRGGLLGIGARQVVEITAAPAPSARRASSGGAPAPRSAAARAYRSGSGQVPDPGADAFAGGGRNGSGADRGHEPLDGRQSRPDLEAVGDWDRERTRRLAMALAEQHARAEAAQRSDAPQRAADTRRIDHDAPQHGPARPSAEPAPPTPPPSGRPPAAVVAADRSPAARDPERTATARRYLLVPEGGVNGPSNGSGHGPPDRPSEASAPGGRQLDALHLDGLRRDRRAVPSGETEAMREEIAAIRALVTQVLERQVVAQAAPASDGPGAGAGSSGVPDALQPLYLQLVAQDLSRELADEIVAAVRRELGDGPIDAAAARASAISQLERIVPVAETPVPAASPDGRPVTIALIGPTGVGKTTTLAKLAAAFKLRHGLEVGLVTCDTYRIAAVEQLRTYANIIGIPVHVAMTPEEMAEACARLADRDVVLIDTAGRSQNDGERLEELRAFLDAAQPHEVHLVLSSTASEKVLVREAEAFGAIGADKVVLTKLDEAVSFGMLVNVVRRVGKAVSFMTTGQEVPDQIEIGRPRRLAELVLDGGARDS